MGGGCTIPSHHTHFGSTCSALGTMLGRGKPGDTPAPVPALLELKLYWGVEGQKAETLNTNTDKCEILPVGNIIKGIQCQEDFRTGSETKRSLGSMCKDSGHILAQVLCLVRGHEAGEKGGLWE